MTDSILKHAMTPAVTFLGLATMVGCNNRPSYTASEKTPVTIIVDGAMIENNGRSISIDSSAPALGGDLVCKLDSSAPGQATITLPADNMKLDPSKPYPADSAAPAMQALYATTKSGPINPYDGSIAASQANQAIASAGGACLNAGLHLLFTRPKQHADNPGQ